MEPYLRQGDHVLTFNWVKVEAGYVIVFKVSDEYFVKRVKKIAGKNIFVEGDNKKMSLGLGPIRREQIVGRVVLKY